MEIPLEEWPHEGKEEWEIQDLEKLEKGKFIFSITELKDLCRVGTLAFNLMSSLMLTWATISPHWAQLSYKDKVMFSSLWETCVEAACWKTGDPEGYLLYGRCFIVFATVFSFFLNCVLLGFFFQFCPTISQEYLLFAILDTIAGIAVFIGLLMHMLQMKSYEAKGPRVTYLWPYFILFLCFILFLYSAILFILIHKEFCHAKCLRSSHVTPKNSNLEGEAVNLEPMESHL